MVFVDGITTDPDVFVLDGNKIGPDVITVEPDVGGNCVFVLVLVLVLVAVLVAVFVASAVTVDAFEEVALALFAFSLLLTLTSKFSLSFVFESLLLSVLSFITELVFVTGFAISISK